MGLSAVSSVQAAPGLPPLADAPLSDAGQAVQRGVGLEQCLYLADRNHPDLANARAQLSKVEAQLTEAYFAPYMSMRAFGGMSLAPTVQGNNVYSPNTDVSLTSNLGVAWRVGLDGTLPLWTFGKITNSWDAAEANVEVKRHSIEVTRDGIRFDVRKAYFGLQLARDGLALLEDASGALDEAVDKLDIKVKSDEADPIDLYKLRMAVAELAARRAMAERFEKVALAGLRFYTGMPRLEVADIPLRRAGHRLGHLAKYMTAARLFRPEMKMAKAGLEAYEALVRANRSGLFPDLALVWNVGLSAAPEVADQINPYVSDPGNYLHYGAALVFQWRLDVVPQAARIRQAEADYEAMVATDRKALGGIAVEVEHAYAEVVDWQKRYQAYRKAAKYAKRWLVTVQTAIDVGTMEEKDLVDPAKAYAEHRYNVLNATMELNVAVCKLAKATGWDTLAPDGN